MISLNPIAYVNGYGIYTLFGNEPYKEGNLQHNIDNCKFRVNPTLLVYKLVSK